MGKRIQLCQKDNLGKVVFLILADKSEIMRNLEINPLYAFKERIKVNNARKSPYCLLLNALLVIPSWSSAGFSSEIEKNNVLVSFTDKWNWFFSTPNFDINLKEIIREKHRVNDWEINIQSISHPWRIAPSKCIR